MLGAVIAWLVLGAIAGWIATMITGSDARYGAGANVVIGIIGGFIGGIIVRLFGGSGVTGFNLWSLIVAIIGAVVLLWLVQGFRGRRTTI